MRVKTVFLPENDAINLVLKLSFLSNELYMSDLK